MKPYRLHNSAKQGSQVISNANYSMYTNITVKKGRNTVSPARFYVLTYIYPRVYKGLN